jgi:hypothetical protein
MDQTIPLILYGMSLANEPIEARLIESKWHLLRDENGKGGQACLETHFRDQREAASCIVRARKERHRPTERSLKASKGRTQPAQRPMEFREANFG